MFLVAQFTLATQILSLGVLYILNLFPIEQFFFILCTQILSLVISAVLMFGNRMLLTSLFSTTLFSFYFVCFFDYFLLQSSSVHSNRLIIIIRRLVIFSIAFLLIKFLIINLLFSTPDDDAHIWDILKSKFFPKFHTFDTRLYTCAKEFDFMEMETMVKLCQTGLVPLAFIVICRLIYDLVYDIFISNEKEKKTIWNHYHLIQTGAYVLIGLLIMRLKLFPVPQLCLLLSLWMNEELWPKRMISLKKWKFLICIVIIIGMGIQGQYNIREQIKIKGYYIDNLSIDSMLFSS